MEDQHVLVRNKKNLKFKKNSKNDFKGDSGGGLTIQDGTRRILVGIVSFGSEFGCQRGYPAAFR